jgi:hypothetical protein
MNERHDMQPGTRGTVGFHSPEHHQKVRFPFGNNNAQVYKQRLCKQRSLLNFFATRFPYLTITFVFADNLPFTSSITPCTSMLKIQLVKKIKKWEGRVLLQAKISPLP